MKNLIFLFLIFISPTSWAGEWGSSGGEFLRDRHNPWFLKNVDAVTYCITVDESGISTTKEKIKELTEKAIQYWKTEFAKSGNTAGIGKQQFLLFPSECKGSEDIQIQFGFGTLSESQKKTFAQYSGDFHDYVAVTVRTDYDKKKLRGKGFLFVASDKGSDPYNRGIGIELGLWKYDQLLYLTLLHEIGHIFGVDHTENSFMAADFPETILRQFRKYRLYTPHSFFVPQEELKICDFPNCPSLISKDNWQTVSLRSNGILIPFENINRLSTEPQFPVKIYLNPEQEVLSALPGEFVWRGPARQSFKLSGEITPPNKNEKTFVLLELSPDKVDIFTSASVIGGSTTKLPSRDDGH